MQNRRAHRRALRRLIAGLITVIVGGIGSFAIATPGQAAIPCAVTYTGTYWGDPAAPQYYVNARIQNTGPVTSTGWVVYISFSPGTTTELYWNMKPMPEYGDGWYTAADYVKAIQPGQTANFGLVVDPPPPDFVGAPTSFQCSIF